MADRAMMWCPMCDKNGVNTEVVKKDNVDFQCGIGHNLGDYNSLMAQRPRMMKLEVVHKPNVGDVKTEVWINGEALNKFNQMYPNQLSATLDNIVRQHLDGDLIIIDGMQARELKSLGIRTGAEMLSAIKNGKTLEDTNTTLSNTLDALKGMFQKAGVESPV